MKVAFHRFWSYVNKQGPIARFNQTRCWIWVGGHNDNGYGLLYWEGKLCRAHRIAWRLFHGVWPSKNACHRCDVRDCVRPSHLFDGTQADNLRDMAAKGRSTHGAKHASAKLTTKQVLSIRAQLEDGMFQRDLAEKYKVSQGTISEINTRKAWTHAEESV